MLMTYGLHHVSSIVGHAQKNLDFYGAVLGLRLVKKTLNFDDPDHYHFYFSNHDGSSGLVTTFPREDLLQGRVGQGQIGRLGLSIEADSLAFWKERLTAFKIDYQEKDDGLYFVDPDGLELALIVDPHRPENHWQFNGVSQPIRGIHSVTLHSKNIPETAKLLEHVLGFKRLDDQTFENQHSLVYLPEKKRDPGISGTGTVHHVAFRVREEDMENWRLVLIGQGFKPTEIKNRKYFKSIYFREKGGILIELASIGPGVLVDETLDTLGETLKIPPGEQAPTDLMEVQLRTISRLENYGYRNKREWDILVRKHRLLAAIQQENDPTRKEQLKEEYLKITKEIHND